MSFSIAAASLATPVAPRALSRQRRNGSGAMNRSRVAGVALKRSGALQRQGEVEECAPPSKAAPQEQGRETVLMSVAPVPILTLAAAEGLKEALEPVGELVRSFDLPPWLIQWGHPGNMAVVLLAMGGYGTYLGWQIRTASSGEAVLAAKDSHPKLMAGMFFFFALGATGGVTSLVTQGRSIFDSPHAYTGLAGLALLTAQSALSANFKGNAGYRTIHAYLGTATMALFLVHAALVLKLGLSI